MARSLKDIKWDDPAHAATAFLTVIIMPLTYSIAYGLLAGIACWIVLQSLFKLFAFIGIERPSFVEDENDESAFPSKEGKEGSSDDVADEHADHGNAMADSAVEEEEA